MPRSGPPSLTSSPASPRPGRPTASWRRAPAASSPRVPTAAPLTHHRVLQVLKNPSYAGAYVHGRHVTRKKIDADGNVRTVTAEVPRAQWKVLIKDHHPGYVTWDEYLAAEARLA